jgi:SprT protein
MTADKVYITLQQHLPQESLPYCFRLWQDNPFILKITKTRQSKVGDFMSRRDVVYQQITLNHDLNPYLFLVTYIHEVAHLHVYLRFRNKVEPHGNEWKNTFKQLIEPILQKSVFPEEILHVLVRHMANPKASSFADSDLTKAFRLYDKNAGQFACLSDLPEGSQFQFQGRYFKKGTLKRTRIVCREVNTKRNYLIPADVLVTNVQLSFLV